MLEALDVLDTGLENRPLVRPRVPHDLEEGIRVLGQQTAQLLDSVIDVEPATTLDCRRCNGKRRVAMSDKCDTVINRELGS